MYAAGGPEFFDKATNYEEGYITSYSFFSIWFIYSTSVSSGDSVIVLFYKTPPETAITVIATISPKILQA